MAPPALKSFHDTSLNRRAVSFGLVWFFILSMLHAFISLQLAFHFSVFFEWSPSVTVLHNGVDGLYCHYCFKIFQIWFFAFAFLLSILKIFDGGTVPAVKVTSATQSLSFENTFRYFLIVIYYWYISYYSHNTAASHSGFLLFSPRQRYSGKAVICQCHGIWCFRQQLSFIAFIFRQLLLLLLSGKLLFHARAF